METSWFIPFEYERIRPRWFRVIQNCLSYIDRFSSYKESCQLTDRVGRELLLNRIPYHDEEKLTILYTIMTLSVPQEEIVHVHDYFYRYHGYKSSDTYLEWLHRIQTGL